MRENRCIQSFGRKTRKKETTKKSLDVDGKVTLKLVLMVYYQALYELDLTWIRIGSSGGFCEHRNEP
jgi:hypothetical protein